MGEGATNELRRLMLLAAREIPDVNDLYRFGRDKTWGLCISLSGVSRTGEELKPWSPIGVAPEGISILVGLSGT
jgi:hypothetical protein